MTLDGVEIPISPTDLIDTKPEVKKSEPLSTVTRRVVESLDMPVGRRPSFRTTAEFKQWVEEKGGADLRVLAKSLSTPHDRRPQTTDEIAEAFAIPDTHLQATMRKLAFTLNETPVDPSTIILEDYRSLGQELHNPNISTPFIGQTADYEPVAEYSAGVKKMLTDEAVSEAFRPLDPIRPTPAKKGLQSLPIRAYLQLILGASGAIPFQGGSFGGLRELGRKKNIDFNPHSHEAAITVISPLVGRSTVPSSHH